MSKTKTTPEMTDFQKFLSFRQKERELDELKAKLYLLIQHGQMAPVTIRRAIRISQARWNKYIFGQEPLPGDFLWKFKQRFKTELADSQRKADSTNLDQYFKGLRSFAKINSIGAHATSEPSKEGLISSPSRISKI